MDANTFLQDHPNLFGENLEEIMEVALLSNYCPLCMGAECSDWDEGDCEFDDEDRYDGCDTCDYYSSGECEIDNRIETFTRACDQVAQEIYITKRIVRITEIVSKWSKHYDSIFFRIPSAMREFIKEWLGVYKVYDTKHSINGVEIELLPFHMLIHY